MFKALLDFLINLFLNIITIASAIMFTPILIVLNNYIPNFNLYLETVEDFITDYVLKGVAFAREVFFNVTGFPHGLFNFLLAYLGFKIGLFVIKGLLKAISNAYFLVRGSSGGKK